jgi:hypothetical protein
MLAAPVVVQLNVLLSPEEMLAGLAVKELMVAALGAVTLTVTVAVTGPVALVAFSVYVVATVGFTIIEPFANADVNVPGVMAMLAAPLVVQLNVVLAPELMLVGFAVKEMIAGDWPASGIEVIEVNELQATSPAKTKEMRIGEQSPGREEIGPEKSSLLPQEERVECMRSPFFLSVPSG